MVGNLGLAVALTLSGVSQPWLAKYLADWKTFNWAIYAQMITIVVVPFILPESCRWLMSKGEKDKTIKILKKIAKTNKKTVPDEVWKDVAKLCDKIKANEDSNNYTYLDLFRTANMRKITFLVIVLWMIISVIFDTTVRNISNLNFEFYLSFMIAAGMELPADLGAIVGINWLGRRWSASISMLLSSVTMLICAFTTGKSRIIFNFIVLQFHDLDQYIVQVITFLIGRFFATYAMNVGFQIVVEVMPTCLRGQGSSLVNCMSMLSMMASPYIVYSVTFRLSAVIRLNNLFFSLSYQRKLHF